jgi:hypothetical protein
MRYCSPFQCGNIYGIDLFLVGILPALIGSLVEECRYVIGFGAVAGGMGNLNIPVAVSTALGHRPNVVNGEHVKTNR